MTGEEIVNLTDNLACEWVLTEVETEDLLAFGSTIAMCENEASTIRIHMEMRAEVLAMVGSDMEEWIEGFKEAYGG